MLHDFKSSNRFGGSERATIEVRFGKRRHKNQNCSVEKSFTLDSQWRQIPRNFDDNYKICFAISGKFLLRFFLQILNAIAIFYNSLVYVSILMEFFIHTFFFLLGSYDQKITTDLLGNCSKNRTRWPT